MSATLGYRRGWPSGSINGSIRKEGHSIARSTAISDRGIFGASLARQSEVSEGPAGRNSWCSVSQFTPPTREDGMTGLPVELHKWLKFVVGFTVAANMLQMGACTGDDDLQLCPVLACQVSEQVFTVVFVMEFLVKVFFQRKAYFVSDLWHLLEFVLAMTAVVDSWILTPLAGFGNSHSGEGVIILFWLLRLLRFPRLLQLQPKLMQLFEALTASMRQVASVCVLLGIVVYAAAIFCVTCFQSIQTDCPMTFATLPRAMFTLFTMSIVADWTDIVAPVVEEHWWSSLFFVGFTFFATFGILNLVVGVITERIMAVQSYYQDLEECIRRTEHQARMGKIADVIFKEQDDSTIDKQEMQDYVQGDRYGDELKELLVDAELPTGYKIWDCHAMFDRDASGTITKSEFMQGMHALIFSNEFQRSSMTRIAISDVMAAVKELKTDLHKLRVDLLLTPERSENQEAALSGSLASEGDIPKPEAVRKTQLDMHGNLPAERLPQGGSLASCRVLIERLREPLAQLLADNLSKGTHPSELRLAPAGRVSESSYERICRARGSATAAAKEEPYIDSGDEFGAQSHPSGDDRATASKGISREQLEVERAIESRSYSHEVLAAI